MGCYCNARDIHDAPHRFALPKGAAWLNYVRSHDDIGWGFADEDAADVGIEPNNHRRFLNRFYTRQFEGSFASGIPFNYNPRTQDMRICGTTASLAGLETALSSADPNQVEAAVQRMGRLFTSLVHLINLRKQTPELASTETRFFDLRNKHVFAYVRSEAILVLVNFSEFAQHIPGDALQPFDRSTDGFANDLITGRHIGVRGELVMSPLEQLWLRL